MVLIFDSVVTNGGSTDPHLACYTTFCTSHAQGQLQAGRKTLAYLWCDAEMLRVEGLWCPLQKRRGEQHIQGGPACTACG